MYTTSDQQVKEQQQIAQISTYFERTYGSMKKEMQETTEAIHKVQQEINQLQSNIQSIQN